MTPERFQQIRNVFEATLERKPEERAEFLGEAARGDDQLRGEVERLLNAHERRSGPIEQPVIALLGGAETGEPWRLEGHRIGAYEVLREIGEGGIATVYLARRVDGAYHQLVAIKVVRREAASDDVLSRFRQERGILASLDHSNIARILDAGTLEGGLPYVVMEYVEGQPIDVYCDEHRLSIGQRLGLFRQVCTAVRYAHQQHVIHRDLKPANILVTGDGRVKLLDFGIAKLLAPGNDPTACLTRTGLLMMTPEYASPEQVKGEPTGAASDVYSLGVVLYELLTGRRPYRLRSRILHEIMRVICEEPPIIPSAAVTQSSADEPKATTPEAASRARRSWPDELKRELSGDLDGILLKALDKNPSRRYTAVERFEEDLGNHLEGRPVRARNTLLGRVAGFARRNPGWMLAGFTVTVSLLTGSLTIAPGLWPVAGALAVAAASAYVTLRSEVGSEIARRAISGRIYYFLGLFTLMMALVALPLRMVSNVVALAWFALIPWLAYYQVRWPFRSRWAGSLILDLSRSNPAWIAINSGVLVACSAAFMLARSPSIGFHDVVYCLGLVLLAALNYFLYARVEIREAGIVSMGCLIRWRNIESYGWESGQGDFDTLRVQSSGVRRLLPAAQLIVPKELTGKVKAALEERLPMWPG